MITITESRVLTLYLCDADGQPVRAATDEDLRRAGWMPHGTFATSHEAELERLRARLAAWEPVVREAIVCGCMGMASMALSKAVDLLPPEHCPEVTP